MMELGVFIDDNCLTRIRKYINVYTGMEPFISLKKKEKCIYLSITFRRS